MGTRNRRKFRTLVLRGYAERYLVILLVCFALTVSGTRFFLEITGYPKIGSGGLHIAHVLWGGLIWFVGSLFPLLFTNKRSFDLSAVLTGVGSGLFMDEIGKFTTADNNYFFPADAAMVYAFFLLIILVINWVRKKSPASARELVFRMMELFEEVVEGDLSNIERDRLLEEVEEIQKMDAPDHLREITEGIRKIIMDSNQQLAPENPDFFQKIQIAWRKSISCLFPEDKNPVWLYSLWILWGLVSVVHPLALISINRTGVDLPWILEELLMVNFDLSQPLSFWENVRLGGEGFLGFLLMLAGALGFLRKKSIAVAFAYYANLVLMVFINLLVFYFDQFSAIVFTFAQLVVLILTNQYRKVI